MLDSNPIVAILWIYLLMPSKQDDPVHWHTPQSHTLIYSSPQLAYVDWLSQGYNVIRSKQLPHFCTTVPPLLQAFFGAMILGWNQMLSNPWSWSLEVASKIPWSHPFISNSYLPSTGLWKRRTFFGAASASRACCALCSRAYDALDSVLPQSVPWFKWGTLVVDTWGSHMLSYDMSLGQGVGSQWEILMLKNLGQFNLIQEHFCRCNCFEGGESGCSCNVCLFGLPTGSIYGILVYLPTFTIKINQM